MSVIAIWLMGKLGISARPAKLASWGIALLCFALLIGMVVWWFNDTVDDARDAGMKQGATVERIEAQGKVIENVQKAKAAADAVRRDGGPTVAECLQDSRVRENC